MGALIGVGLLGCLLLVQTIRSLTNIGIATFSTVASYGFSVYIGTWAIAALSTGRWPLAIGLGSITVFYLWLTTQQIFSFSGGCATPPEPFFMAQIPVRQDLRK